MSWTNIQMKSGRLPYEDFWKWMVDRALLLFTVNHNLVAKLFFYNCYFGTFRMMLEEKNEKRKKRKMLFIWNPLKKEFSAFIENWNIKYLFSYTLYSGFGVSYYYYHSFNGEPFVLFQFCSKLFICIFSFSSKS